MKKKPTKPQTGVDIYKAWAKKFPKGTTVKISETDGIFVAVLEKLPDFQFAYKFEDKKKKK